MVEFGLDPKNFTTGQKTIVEALRNLESQASRSSVGVGHSASNIVGVFRNIQQPIAALRRQMEVLAVSTIAPQRGLNQIAQQGQRTGSAVSGAATAGAISLRGMAIAGVAAFGVFETLKKTIEGASASANRTFGTSIGASGAGMNITRFSAIAQALRVTGNVPEQQTEAWLRDFAQRQTSALRGDRGALSSLTQGMAYATTALGINTLVDKPEMILRKFAAASQNMTDQMAINIGREIGFTDEQSLALKRNGAALEENIRIQERMHSTTEADRKAALELLNAENALSVAWNALTRTMYTAVIPALVKVLEVSNKFLDLIKGEDKAKSPTGISDATAHDWAKVGAGLVGGAAAGAAIGGGIGLIGGPIGAGAGAAIGGVVGAVGGAWNWNAGAKPPEARPLAPGAGTGPRSSADYPPSLDQRIIAREGSGDSAVSPAGAIGRNQIMPQTAAGYGVTREELFDPKKNMELGNRIRRDLWNKYHDEDAVMVAYNAGPRVADRWLASGKNPSVLPIETRRYIGSSHAMNRPGARYDKGWPFPVQAGAPSLPTGGPGWSPEGGPGFPSPDKRGVFDKYGRPLDLSNLPPPNPIDPGVAAFIRSHNAMAAGNTTTTNHGDVTTGDIHIHTASNDPATHGRLVNDSIRNMAYPSNSGAF